MGKSFAISLISLPLFSISLSQLRLSINKNLAIFCTRDSDMRERLDIHIPIIRKKKKRDQILYQSVDLFLAYAIALLCCACASCAAAAAAQLVRIDLCFFFFFTLRGFVLDVVWLKFALRLIFLSKSFFYTEQEKGQP